MPFVISLFCDKCGDVTKDVFFKDFNDWEQKENKMICFKEECYGKLKRLWDRGCNIIIKENNDPVSCKPSSYWRNAEKVKQKRIKRNKESEKEKKFYGDSRKNPY